MDGRVGFRRETGHRNQVSVHRFLKIAVKPLIRHLPAASLQLCVQHPVELRETLVEMALAVNHVGSSWIVNKKRSHVWMHPVILFWWNRTLSWGY